MNDLIRNISTTVCAVAAFAAAPAMAKNVVADVDQIADVMKAAGYKAEIKESSDSKGDRYIRSGVSGYGFSIFFFGCDNSFNNCKSVQFYSSFAPKVKPSLDQMNTHARENRWGRVYLDKDGDPAIEFDVDLEVGGMSEELFLDNLAYWEAILNAYSKFVFAKN